MIPAKEAKELLYNLLSEKFVNLQVKMASALAGLHRLMRY